MAGDGSGRFAGEAARRRADRSACGSARRCVFVRISIRASVSGDPDRGGDVDGMDRRDFGQVQEARPAPGGRERGTRLRLGVGYAR